MESRKKKEKADGEVDWVEFDRWCMKKKEFFHFQKYYESYRGDIQ